MGFVEEVRLPERRFRVRKKLVVGRVGKKLLGHSWLFRRNVLRGCHHTGPDSGMMVKNVD